MQRIANLLAGLFLVWSLLGGCSTHRTDTVAYERTDGPEVVERQTTTTKESSTTEDTGVLSGTVNVIGEVVALPFRAVGGLIRAIF